MSHLTRLLSYCIVSFFVIGCNTSDPVTIAAFNNSLSPTTVPFSPVTPPVTPFPTLVVSPDSMPTPSPLPSTTPSPRQPFLTWLWKHTVAYLPSILNDILTPYPTFQWRVSSSHDSQAFAGITLDKSFFPFIIPKLSSSRLYCIDSRNRLIDAVTAVRGQSVLILIHGNNQETHTETLFRWNRFIHYIQQYPEQYIKMGSPLLVFYQYSSVASVQQNATTLESLISQLYPNNPIFFLGHSRGGVVARATRDVDYNPYHYGGIVQLASPNHGSPLAIPGWMQATFATQELPEIKMWLYLNTIMRFNAYFSLSSRGLDVAQMMEDGGYRFLSEGTRSLFYDGHTVHIPTGQYTSSDNLVTINLDPDQRLGMRTDTTPLPSYVFMEGASRIVDNTEVYNYMDALNMWEEYIGVLPDTIAHAGYFYDVEKNNNEAQALLNAGGASIKQFLFHDDDNYEAQGLQWCSTEFARIPTGPDETDFLANDGFVDVCSQCDCLSGDSMTVIRDGTLIINRAVLKRRQGKVLDCILHRGNNHADMVGTNETAYWDSVVDSLAFLIKRYQLFYIGPDSVLLPNERQAIYTLFSKQFSVREDKIRIMRYNRGWRITVLESKTVPRSHFYAKKENNEWKESNANELAYLP